MAKTPKKKKHVKVTLPDKITLDPKRDGGDIKFHAQVIIFETHTQPHGYLPKDFAAQALWMYNIDAMRAYRTVGKGIDTHARILEGDPWHNTQYKQQAKTTAMWYGVTVDEMAKYWPAVRLECAAKGLPEPRWEYMNFGFEEKTKEKALLPHFLSEQAKAKVLQETIPHQLQKKVKVGPDFDLMAEMRKAKRIDDGPSESNTGRADTSETDADSVLKGGKDSLRSGGSEGGV